jgi:hypothetical protein
MARARNAPGEQVKLRIGNLAKAVLVSGQVYQDPKEALSEFVSNAAADDVEAGRSGERIRIPRRTPRRYAPPGGGDRPAAVETDGRSGGVGEPGCHLT